MLDGPGLGTLMPFLSKDDIDRRAFTATLGRQRSSSLRGVTFAAFPPPTMFSGSIRPYAHLRLIWRVYGI
jgi:hypothetical protein